ncbi:MAG: hypothetical protein LBU94_01685 [Clostridiales bacterium]|jgi:hypothetical protein|nr:hypothetical protein [Clostridiales bacterium]
MSLSTEIYTFPTKDDDFDPNFDVMDSFIQMANNLYPSVGVEKKNIDNMKFCYAGKIFIFLNSDLTEGSGLLEVTVDMDNEMVYIKAKK